LVQKQKESNNIKKSIIKMSDRSKEFAFQLDQLKKKKTSQSISLNQPSDIQKAGEQLKQDQ
jgi:hypothetical protein